jgi:hypothetical protein
MIMGCVPRESSSKRPQETGADPDSLLSIMMSSGSSLLLSPDLSRENHPSAQLRQAIPMVGEQGAEFSIDRILSTIMDIVDLDFKHHVPKTDGAAPSSSSTIPIFEDFSSFSDLQAFIESDFEDGLDSSDSGFDADHFVTEATENASHQSLGVPIGGLFSEADDDDWCSFLHDVSERSRFLPSPPSTPMTPRHQVGQVSFWPSKKESAFKTLLKNNPTFLTPMRRKSDAPDLGFASQHSNASSGLLELSGAAPLPLLDESESSFVPFTHISKTVEQLPSGVARRNPAMTRFVRFAPESEYQIVPTVYVIPVGVRDQSNASSASSPKGTVASAASRRQSLDTTVSNARRLVALPPVAQDGEHDLIEIDPESVWWSRKYREAFQESTSQIICHSLLQQRQSDGSHLVPRCLDAPIRLLRHRQRQDLRVHERKTSQGKNCLDDDDDDFSVACKTHEAALLRKWGVGAHGRRGLEMEISPTVRRFREQMARNVQEAVLSESKRRRRGSISAETTETASTGFSSSTSSLDQRAMDHDGGTEIEMSRMAAASRKYSKYSLLFAHWMGIADAAAAAAAWSE